MFLNPTDLVTLYHGVRTRSWCFELYRIIKRANFVDDQDNKFKLVTVRQFCDFTGSDPADVYAKLGLTNLVIAQNANHQRHQEEQQQQQRNAA